MIFIIRRSLLIAALTLSAFLTGPVAAKEDVKDTVKQGCSVAGGSYSSGANYARCEYSNGDSYTCNTDVNKCESCTNGKCTVAIKQPGSSGVPSGPKVLAPATSPVPGKVLAPAHKSAPTKKAL
jgi:hypothetical protein